MTIRKKRKGDDTFAVSLVVLFIIIVILTMSPEVKQTALDLIVMAKGSAP